VEKKDNVEVAQQIEKALEELGPLSRQPTIQRKNNEGVQKENGKGRSEIKFVGRP
jgi:hypothetical protein